MARLEMLKLVVPPLNVPVPKVVAPSINVTVPVAADGVTTAVKVNVASNGEGLAADETEVAEPCSTVCVSFEDVLLL